MKKISIHRTRIGKDIVAEFAMPLSAKHIKAGNVAIIARGAPSMPGKSSLIDFLVRKGFYVIVPRYRGSWESGGRFLAKEPTDDIREVIDALKKPLMSFYEGKTYTFPKKPSIHLFVASFGGPAGLLLSNDKRVSKVIAFSPVCDWRVRSEAEPLEHMDRFVKLAYGEGYRLAPGAWKKLAKGDFYNPMTSLKKVDGEKTLIFHARNDDVVPFSSVFDFSYTTGATLKATTKGGHLGLNELMEPDTWREVARFLKV